MHWPMRCGRAAASTDEKETCDVMKALTKAILLLAVLATPAVALAALGLVYLYEHRSLIWLIPGLFFWQVAALLLVKRWDPWAGLDDAWKSLASEGEAPGDREAQAIVEEMKEQVVTGSYRVTTQTFLDLARELVERIAVHYHPESENPILRVPIPFLLRAVEEAAGDMARMSLKIPLSHRITFMDIKHGRRAWMIGKAGLQVFRLLAPFINPQGALAREIMNRLVVSPLSTLVKANLEQATLIFFLDRLGCHLITLYGGKLPLRKNGLADDADRLGGGGSGFSVRRRVLIIFPFSGGGIHAAGIPAGLRNPANDAAPEPHINWG